MEYVLQAFSLTKKYKDNWALSGVDISIEKGDIYGFVGENGSGKTTVIRVITGLISPNGGKFELFGVSSDKPEIIEARKRIGAIVETPSIYHNFSAYDNLKMQSTIIGINDDSRIKSVLCEVGLSELYDSKKSAGNFSLGMRQRLGIAMALLGEPEFIILDEPMNGLDPAGIVEIRELILKLNREKGITFLISSHILTELALVATKYGIISKGKIIKEITAKELRDECRQSVILEVDKPDLLLSTVSSFIPKEDISLAPSGLKIYGSVSLNQLFDEINKAGITILSVNSQKASIEDYYLATIGGNHNA